MARKPERRKEADDETRLAEVEAGIASSPPVPDDIASEAGEVALSGDEGNAARLRQAWLQVKQREAAWLKARARTEDEAEKLASERQALAAERKEIAAERVGLDERLARVEEREKALAEEDKALETKRSEARAGFAADRREIVSAAVEERDRLTKELANIDAEARRRAPLALEDLRTELEDERREAKRERKALKAKTVALREREAQLEADRAFMKERGRVLAEQFERQVGERVAAVQTELDDARELLERERERGLALKSELTSLRDRLSLFDDAPEILTERLNVLETELADARHQLAQRPPAAEVDGLRSRLREAQDAAADAKHWQQRHDEVAHQLAYQLVHVGELEVLRDERDALRAQRETLRQSIAQHRQDWEELQTKDSALVPFPACSAYDEDRQLSARADLREVASLRELAAEIRERMSTQAETAYYYSDTDVRLFLAGLASSRLHLLQGISGTGKTSLPGALFRALGGQDAAQIVEVQAGWRDKDDLFGYYNAFEKRFAESEFTKALYRAHVPVNKDRPMVIVLDEMNLAHPEQYFGSMLSVLENSVGEQRSLELLTSVVPGLPRHFKGSALPLPPNVWFVGTANHDETTVAFADKTYDRAHVQELPSRHVPFAATSRDYDAVSFASLQRAFEAARRARRQEVDRAWEFLTGSLAPELETFGIGWGNRLQRQVESFVPVVVEAGGTLPQAVDHLVSTKLVRKLENKFGVRVDDLDRLEARIQHLWADLGKEQPHLTLRKIRDEAARVRGGFGG